MPARSSRRGQDDVRRERDQFRCLFANLGGVGRGPAGVDAHIAADVPAQQRQPLHGTLRGGPATSGSSAAAGCSTPIRRTRSPCCARVTRGDSNEGANAAAPMPVMKSRRRTRPPRPNTQLYARDGITLPMERGSGFGCGYFASPATACGDPLAERLGAERAAEIGRPRLGLGDDVIERALDQVGGLGEFWSLRRSPSQVSSIATEPISEAGLATSWPAMSGAEPCWACASACSSPALIEAARPRLPEISEASSDRMSPNALVVDDHVEARWRRAPAAPPSRP